MINFIGNCSNLNWDAVIADLDNTEPAYVGPRHKKGDKLDGVNEVTKLWEKGNYKPIADGGTLGWDMYFPGQQFDELVIKKFVDFFEIENYHTAWISCIHVGNYAPVHWDVNDKDDVLDDCVRYHCHIGQPAVGHIFIAGDEAFYNRPQGSTYMWSSRKLWHAGSNCGLQPKYLLNLW
jgi:hypothetical protein